RWLSSTLSGDGHSSNSKCGTIPFMADRTGIARGTLRAVVFFERASDNYVILAPREEGDSLEHARMIYEARYKSGWRWCEAGTLSDVDRLQSRLRDQEERRIAQQCEVNQEIREEVRRRTGAALRQIMVSSSTTPWERDFIQKWEKLQSEKRNKFN